MEFVALFCDGWLFGAAFAVCAEHCLKARAKGGAGLLDREQREFFPERDFLRAICALLDVIFDLIVEIVAQAALQIIREHFCNTVTFHCHSPRTKPVPALAAFGFCGVDADWSL